MSAAAFALPHDDVSAGPFSDIAAALGGPRENIESAFLQVGSRLAQCMGILGRISSVFEALPRDFESSELLEASTGLEALGHEAQRMAASFAEERQTMASLLEAVGAARWPIEDLQRTVKMIGIVAVNARVVAAGVVDEMDGVEVFTTDIAALSNEAAAAVNAFSSLYQRLVGDVQRADAQRAHFEAAHHDTLTGLAQRIGGQLGRVGQTRQEAAAGSARTSQMSRQIAERVSAAVSALQVGDNTRQRVEHVEAALGLLDELMRGGTRPELGEDFALDETARPALADAVCRLQSAQLEATVDSFEREVAVAERAFRELAADTADIAVQSRRLYGNQAGGKDAPLAALSAEVRLASALLRDCEAERKKLDLVAAEVGTTVRSLLDHVEAVQAIEANMRLLSLNATVKCSQLGNRGRALNVIAQQLRELTGETVSSAEAAVGSLDRAADLARAVAAVADADTANQVGRLETEARRAVELLETVEHRLKSALSALDDDAPQAARLLEQAALAFKDQAKIASAMADIGARLFAFLGADAGPLDDPAVATVLARLRKFYTMESERQLHDSIVEFD